MRCIRRYVLSMSVWSASLFCRKYKTQIKRMCSVHIFLCNALSDLIVQARCRRFLPKRRCWQMQPDTTSDYYQLSFPKFRWHLYSSCHTVGAESFGHKVNNQHRTHKNRLIVRSLLAKQKKPAKQERRPFSFLLGKLSLQNIQTIIGGNFLCREENCRTLFLNPSLIT